MKLLKENPDKINSLHLDMNDEQSIPVTFFIYEGIIIYSTKPELHFGVENTIKDTVFASYKKNTSKEIKELLKNQKIFILNEDNDFYNPNKIKIIFNKIKKEQFSNPNIVIGRLFAVDSGYISFWQNRNTVLKNLKYVNQFINRIGGTPEKVKWEIVNQKTNESIIVDYDKYTSHLTPSEYDEELRKKEYAKHTQAGMKKATKTDIPFYKKLNLFYKQKTTIGDSYNIFDKLYDEVIKEQRVFSFDGQFGYTEVIKNPTPSEIKSIIRNNRSSALAGILIVNENEFYVFNRDNEFHKNVANRLNLKNYIGGLYNGNEYFFVSDSTSSKYKENPIVSNIIKKTFPKVKEIDFYNQDIVGDWSNLGNPFAESLEDYKGVHKAPSKNYGAPLHDLTQIYPDDIYSDKASIYYGDNSGSLEDNKIIQIFKNVKGKPEKLVKVYRAVPKLKNQKLSINTGDWVTLSKKYAINHGESTLLGKYNIVYKIVPAKTLFTDANSIYEFGYNP